MTRAYLNRACFFKSGCKVRASLGSRNVGESYLSCNIGAVKDVLTHDVTEVSRSRGRHSPSAINTMCVQKSIQSPLYQIFRILRTAGYCDFKSPSIRV